MKRHLAVAVLAVMGLAACQDVEMPVAPEGPRPAEPRLTLGYEPGATVLLVHGYDADGNGWNCENWWWNQEAALAAFGHTGPKLTVGYYSNNVPSSCERNLASTVYTKNFAGDWRLHGGTYNGLNNVLDRNTPIEHVAYRFAWLAARVNADNNAASVRVIAHSMGGLVVRYAIMQSSLGNPDFPTLAQMNITRVITMGTPHKGAGSAFTQGTLQGQQMQPGSAFLQGLADRPRVGSANWIGFTAVYEWGLSAGDGLVTYDSACWDKMIWCGRHLGPGALDDPIARGYAHNQYMYDRNFTTRSERWNTRNPSAGQSWSAPFYDIGAAGMAARNLGQY